MEYVGYAGIAAVGAFLGALVMFLRAQAVIVRQADKICALQDAIVVNNDTIDHLTRENRRLRRAYMDFEAFNKDNKPIQ